MPKNLAAGKRFVIINECLRNNFHIPSTSANTEHRGIWTIEDLAKKIMERLDLTAPPSKRTIENDIHTMRNGELGYEAPIRNERGIGYFYADPNYSITQNPLSEIDIENLKEILGILKQFKGFKYFSDINSIISKIENTVNVSEYSSILFDTIPDAAGLDFIDPITKAIKSKTVLTIEYQPFDQDKLLELTIHPYILKEYNNRWFVLAYSEQDANTWIYALDRIKALSSTQKTTNFPDTKYISNYFKDILGVTRPKQRKVITVIFKVRKLRANYLITKPLHPSQEIIKKEKKHIIFRYSLIPNRELITFILGMGADLTVLEPEYLKNEIKSLITSMQQNYNSY